MQGLGDWLAGGARAYRPAAPPSPLPPAGGLAAAVHAASKLREPAGDQPGAGRHHHRQAVQLAQPPAACQLPCAWRRAPTPSRASPAAPLQGTCVPSFPPAAPPPWRRVLRPRLSLRRAAAGTLRPQGSRPARLGAPPQPGAGRRQGDAVPAQLQAAHHPPRPQGKASGASGALPCCAAQEQVLLQARSARPCVGWGSAHAPHPAPAPMPPPRTPVAQLACR